MEAELQKIRNHLLVIDKDRLAYQKDAIEKLRIQKKEITLLEAEKEEHLRNLRLAESDQVKNRDKERQDKLKSLVEERDEIEEEIEASKKEEQEMDAQIKALEKEYREKFKSRGGAAGSSQSQLQKANKQIRTLENKLDYVSSLL